MASQANAQQNEIKLTAADAAREDFFGRSVAISGNTAIVGARYNVDAGSNSGSAYLFDTVPPPGFVELVPRGSLWSYRDDGTNQGTAWRASEFDDSTWQTGPAQLGYGDDDEATVVSFGGNSNDKHATTYFRHTFEVEDADLVESLSVLLLRDDAAAVYLNGIEIFRDDNLPANANSSTYATSTGDENGEVNFAVESILLVDGENVLAVEVHQANQTSSDISFDLRLSAMVIPIPEPGALTLLVFGTMAIATGWRRRQRTT